MRPTTIGRRATGAACTSILLAASAVTAAGSHAAAATTFDGTCTLNAVRQPLKEVNGVSYELFTGTGTCSGSLDGSTPSTHTVGVNGYWQAIYAPTVFPPVATTASQMQLAFDDGSALNLNLSVNLAVARVTGATGQAIGTLTGNSPFTLSFRTVAPLTSTV